MQQPRAGAGIAEIEHVVGLGEAADADARRRARRRRRRARRAAPSARIAAAVRSTSSPSSRPVISVRPTASAPSISARCEIDLSPGTRQRAARAAPAAGRDERSGGAASDHGIGRLSVALAARRGRISAAEAAPSILLLTGRGARGNGARPTRRPHERREPSGGQARMGHQAHLPELRHALLRSAARSDRLPEMRHAVRSRGASEDAPRARPAAPVEKELEPVGDEELDAELETEEAEAVEERRGGGAASRRPRKRTRRCSRTPPNSARTRTTWPR